MKLSHFSNIGMEILDYMRFLRMFPQQDLTRHQSCVAPQNKWQLQLNDQG